MAKVKYKDISEIRQDYDNGRYRSNIVIPKRVTENYVFDEDLSVRKNREMVAEHNANIDKMRLEKNKESARLDRQLHDDVVAYIMGTCDLNKKQAEIVENYVYVAKHSYMGDYFSAIDEVAEMVEKVLNAK